MLAGALGHGVVDRAEPTTFESGSSFGSTGEAADRIACDADGSLVHVRTDGTFEVTGKLRC